MITAAGASKISLVGFDGYQANDHRQIKMNDVFENYFQLDSSLEITSLTPTSYRIKKGSIFAPKIDKY